MNTGLTRGKFVGATATAAFAGSLAAISTVRSAKDSIDGDELGLTTARNTGRRVADFAPRRHEISALSRGRGHPASIGAKFRSGV
jgi:hypothetical protein